MRRFIHRLSTAWLVLALITAPLPALAAPLAPGNQDGCPMSHAAMQDTAGTHHPIDHAGTDHDTPACPQCAGNSCDHGACEGAGCSTLHLQLSVNTGTFVTGRQPAAGRYPGYIAHFASLPSTPLYRPPV